MQTTYADLGLGSTVIEDGRRWTVRERFERQFFTETKHLRTRLTSYGEERVVNGRHVVAGEIEVAK